MFVYYYVPYVYRNNLRTINYYSYVRISRFFNHRRLNIIVNMICSGFFFVVLEGVSN